MPAIYNRLGIFILGAEIGFNVGRGILFLDFRGSGFSIIDTNYNASSISLDVGYKIGVGNR
jgi:hypothetical protein